MQVGMLDLDPSSPLKFPSPIDYQHYTPQLASWQSNIGHFSEAIEVGLPLIDHPAPEMRVIGQAVGRAYSATGYPEQAMRSYAIALEAAETVGWPIVELATGISRLDTHLTYLAERVRERHRLANSLSKVYARAEGALYSYLSEDQMRQTGHTPLLFVEGRWDLAEALFLSHYRSPAVFGRHRATGWLATLARNRGQVERAWTLINELLTNGPSTAPGNSIFSASQELQHNAALVSMDTGDLDLAIQWLRIHAIALAGLE